MSDPAPLRVTIRRRGNVAVLDIEGEIDGFADRAMNGAYLEAAAGAPARMLLNFAGVEYINSTGIAVIVSVLAQARRDRIPMCGCNLSDHYQEIFRITRLADFVQVYRDEETAIASA